MALSRLYASRGDLDQAVMIAEDVVAQLQSQDRAGLFAGALLDLGQLQYRVGNYDGARLNLEAAVDLYRQSAAPASMVPDLANGLLTLAELSSDNPDAIYYYDEAIEALRHAGPHYDAQLGSAFLKQSQWLMNQSSFDDAKGSAEEAKDIFVRLQDEAQVYACYMTLGQIATRQDYIEAAISNYSAARDRARLAGDRHDEALASLSLASTFDYAGRNPEALDELERAAPAFRELGDLENPSATDPPPQASGGPGSNGSPGLPGIGNKPTVSGPPIDKGQWQSYLLIGSAVLFALMATASVRRFFSARVRTALLNRGIGGYGRGGGSYGPYSQGGGGFNAGIATGPTSAFDSPPGGGYGPMPGVGGPGGVLGGGYNPTARPFRLVLALIGAFVTAAGIWFLATTMMNAALVPVGSAFQLCESTCSTRFGGSVVTGIVIGVVVMIVGGILRRLGTVRFYY